MEVKELELREALSYVAGRGLKLQWLGREPSDYIAELLGIDHSLIESVDPNHLMHLDKESAKRFAGAVFVCYHGVTSHFVAEALKEKFGIDSINLKGGVTATVGEIF